MNIKDRMRRFFYGRYGVDHLSIVLLALGMLLSILAQAFRRPALELLFFLCYALSIYRICSRDIYRRSRENSRLLSIWRKCASVVKLRVRMVREARTFRYLKCPDCKQRLRVPRKKGQINIRCSKCGAHFIRRT